MARETRGKLGWASASVRNLGLRVCCGMLDAVLGDSRLLVATAEDRRTHLERLREPYFRAFQQRCMEAVYGRAPGHHGP
jgi:hypothetical protein